MECAWFSKSSIPCWGHHREHTKILTLKELLPTDINKPPGCNEVSRAVKLFLIKFFFWALKSAHLWTYGSKISDFSCDDFKRTSSQMWSWKVSTWVGECLFLFPSWFSGPIAERLRARYMHLHNTGCHYIIKWDLVNACIKHGGMVNKPTILSTYCMFSKHSVLAKLPTVLYLLLSC